MICLQGGGEFAPACREMDAHLVERAPAGPVVVTALAGAPGREARTAESNGVRHLRALGADAAAAPDVRDDPAAAVAAIDAAGLLFLPGGSPARLLSLVSAEPLRSALRRLLDRGAVLVGASAGAMVLAEWTLLPERGRTPAVARGLGFVPGAVVLPHYGGDDRWLAAFGADRPPVAIGVPECSGVLVHDGEWTPLGARPPTVITAEGSRLLDRAQPSPAGGDTAGNLADRDRGA